MTALKDRFWAKVAFKEFIRHYRKMTAEQKAADIDASMDALEDLDDTGNSFGSKMVRWSMERVDQYPMAQENGKKGGRPRKDTTADGDIREDSKDRKSSTPANIYGDAATSDGAEATTTISDFSEARESQRRAGADSIRGTPSHSAPARSRTKNSRCPNSREDFHAFVADNNLHEALAEEWYAIHEARGWVDENGYPIKNWRGALKNYCIKTEQKRRTA